MLDIITLHYVTLHSLCSYLDLTLEICMLCQNCVSIGMNLCIMILGISHTCIHKALQFDIDIKYKERGENIFAVNPVRHYVIYPFKN